MIKLFTHKKPNYSDVELVVGMKNGDKAIQEACYHKCKTYFNAKYKGVFFAGEDKKDDIFQEAFLVLWMNMENDKIYVEEGELKGKDGKTFTGSLTTYLMKIAKLKNLEIARNKISDEDLIHLIPQPVNEKDEDNLMWLCIEECLSNMHEGCYTILTQFYYNMKTLDQLMEEMTSYESKDALKSSKCKCLKKLKDCSTNMYKRYLKS